mmetsp:Transcript_42866/g.121169  ORF Transcript_42866/g.121169 Transcript_42866/m.121169 type:complete len:208 (-) Transcript_42866:209-832(-)
MSVIAWKFVPPAIKSLSPQPGPPACSAQIEGSSITWLCNRWRQPSPAAVGFAATSIDPWPPSRNSCDKTASMERREKTMPVGATPACVCRAAAVSLDASPPSRRPERAEQRCKAAARPSPASMPLPMRALTTRKASCRCVMATTMPSHGISMSTKGTMSPVPNGSLVSRSLAKSAKSCSVTCLPYSAGGAMRQCARTASADLCAPGK